MNWLFTVAVVIILLIAGLMLFFFMPKPTVFFDPYVTVTEVFANQHSLIKKEVLDNQTQDVKDPVIPIYGFGKIKSIQYPELYNLLTNIPGLQNAGIINLKPKFNQVRGYGLASAVNNTVRHFYTIQESSGHKSGIWIDGEKRFFVADKFICGDMSREHSLFNKDKERYATILFIDVDRQEGSGKSPNTDINKDEILKMFHTDTKEEHDN
jgi:hypothetical protein